MKGKWIVATFIIGTLIMLNLASFTWAETAVLKIGFTAPLSGGGMSWGYGALAGLELAMDDINNAGGLKVGNTLYTLKCIPYDSKYLADPAVTAAKRLIFEDKVKIIFGEVGSAAGVAMTAITEPNKVIFFPDTYTDRMLRPDRPYTFRWQTTNVEYGGPMYMYFRKQWPQAKRVACWYPEDESGQSMSNWEIKNFGPKNGFEVIGFPWERGTVDLTPIATKILAANVDIVGFDGSPPGETGQFINILKGMGWNKPMVKVGSTTYEELLRICGKNANGLIYREYADFTLPSWAALVEKFKAKKYPALPNTMMVPAYDGGMIIFKAIQKAGTVDDTTRIKEALESIKSHEGIQGRVGWVGKENYGINHQLMGIASIVQIVNEKPIILFKVKTED
jgi:branched-chain amino acid transport system substrate-binding protein